MGRLKWDRVVNGEGDYKVGVGRRCGLDEVEYIVGVCSRLEVWYIGRGGVERDTDLVDMTRVGIGI